MSTAAKPSVSELIANQKYTLSQDGKLTHFIPKVLNGKDTCPSCNISGFTRGYINYFKKEINDYVLHSRQYDDDFVRHECHNGNCKGMNVAPIRAEKEAEAKKVAKAAVKRTPARQTNMTPEALDKAATEYHDRFTAPKLKSNEYSTKNESTSRRSEAKQFEIDYLTKHCTPVKQLAIDNVLKAQEALHAAMRLSESVDAAPFVHKKKFNDGFRGIDITFAPENRKSK